MARSISKSCFWGMVAVSWLSILVLGGAWIGVMYTDFLEQSGELRADYYAERRALVRAEVVKAAGVVEAMRKEHLEELRREVHGRADLAFGLGSELLKGFPAEVNVVAKSVLAAMGAERDENSFYQLISDPQGHELLALMGPISHVQDVERLLKLVRKMDHGERQVSVIGSDGRSYAYLVAVRQLPGSSLRIVSGACLDVAEEALKDRVVRALEAIQFAGDGYIFGGTWKGISVVGPSKGRSVWEVTDANGVKLVQMLISAAKRGGDFVSYVMPQMDGHRNSDKLSYAMPIADWRWYIGGGLYVDEIESVILQNKARLDSEIMTNCWMVLAVLVGLSLCAYFISRRLAGRMAYNMDAFAQAWSRAITSGGNVDPEKLHYEEFKELATYANRMLAAKRVANARIKESLDQLEAISGSVPGIIFRCAPDKFWTMRYLSDAVYDITGYLPSDFIDNAVMPFSAIIDPRDRAWMTSVITDAIENRTPYSVEYRVNTKDGNSVWVIEKGQPLYDENGSAISVDGVIFDVTDRKEAQKEHFQHVHYLETMERIESKVRAQNDIHEMLWEVMETIRHAFGADRSWLLYPCDPDADYAKVPIERTIDEFPGANAKDLEFPVDGEVRQVFARALESLEPVPYDSRSGLKVPEDTGAQFGVKSQLTIALHPHSGKPWLMGLHQCSSARVWTEDELLLFKEASRRISDALSNLLILNELKESEERFRTFSEQTMLGLCVVQDNLVVFANQAYCDIFETTVEDMLALPPAGFLKYVHPDDQEFLMDQARKKQAGDPDVVHNYRWRAITETGRVRTVEIHSKTVTLNGRTADLVSLTDVTDIVRSQEQLEEVVAERTRDLAIQAAELEVANERLMRLDELKSSFVTTVSHDLRTPLTSVLGYSKLVRKDLNNALPDLGCSEEGEKLKDRISSNIGIMITEGERLTLLIDEFMDLTSMEAGTATWYDEVTDMAESITQAVKQARIRAMAKPDIHIDVELGGDLPAMTLDSIRFRQVLGHLLDNAIKYTDSGTITVFAESPDGNGLSLSVTDPGKGIPESELEAIFEPFHQVETGDTLVDEVKGSGLGLALSLGIIQHYNGTIRAESLPDRGSTFFVELPGLNAG